ncbi:MAG: methyltransferase type 12 [Thiohalophilus sp.]|uniref:class I SAM-dependent methyltransferase n=1 Tax=Thiohalophilus sp. TaxID=3028392 RepID=UPI002870A8CE|nr:methyltransferase type 12 [Thiohalophilus sp.]MDR9435870.1 methyltransferase type 12 [Thiohalophilus sp.]
MANNTKNHVRTNGRQIFLQQFLKHPLQVGSIIPSSRFLERRIIEAASADTARVIVELGPGTGGTTRALLNVMPRDACLLSIELNNFFYNMINQIDDDRLIPHLGSACDIQAILAEHDLDAPDAVISGIPFSTMSREMGTQIIESVSSALAPQGRFVAYQTRDRVATLCRPIMGSGQTVMEFFNIPPTRIFHWQKKINGEAHQPQVM